LVFFAKGFLNCPEFPEINEQPDNSTAESAVVVATVTKRISFPKNKALALGFGTESSPYG